MLIRDGRRQDTDHGPRRTLQVSDMKMVAWESTGSGKWNRDMTFLFRREATPRPTVTVDRNIQQQAYRAANLEAHRASERLRSAAYRARKKAAR